MTQTSTPYKRHLLANRTRRIPRKVQQIQAEIKSLDQRARVIEDSKDWSAETKASMIKQLRQSYGPLNAQLRALVDRGAELGLRIAA